MPCIHKVCLQIEIWDNSDEGEILYAYYSSVKLKLRTVQPGLTSDKVVIKVSISKCCFSTNLLRCFKFKIIKIPHALSSLWEKDLIQILLPCAHRHYYFLCQQICNVISNDSLLLGLYSLRRCCLISIGIPIINLRWSSDRLRFIMGIPIPVRRRLLSE